MSPDKQGKPPKKPRRRTPAVKAGPSSDDAHDPVFFVRADSSIPGKEFLDAAPTKVSAHMKSVVAAVAAAPPKRFAGGGLWEAMHGDMTGWFEIRVDGPRRRLHYRLFCRLDYEAEGVDKPLLGIVAGLSKPIGTLLSDADYATVRALGEEYFANNPRSIA